MCSGMARMTGFSYFYLTFFFKKEVGGNLWWWALLKQYVIFILRRPAGRRSDVRPGTSKNLSEIFRAFHRFSVSVFRAEKRKRGFARRLYTHFSLNVGLFLACGQLQIVCPRQDRLVLWCGELSFHFENREIRWNWTSEIKICQKHVSRNIQTSPLSDLVCMLSRTWYWKRLDGNVAWCGRIAQVVGAILRKTFSFHRKTFTLGCADISRKNVSQYVLRICIEVKLIEFQEKKKTLWFPEGKFGCAIWKFGFFKNFLLSYKVTDW